MKFVQFHRNIESARTTSIEDEPGAICVFAKEMSESEFNQYVE